MTALRQQDNIGHRWPFQRRSADGFDRRLITPMILGTILNPINSSIIAVSLIPIGRALGAPPSQTVWLVSALYLATAIGQPVVGRLVDTFGPRRLFLIGSALTAIAGVLGTVAPNLAFLILARVILGFGTCSGYPAAMYLIRREAKRTGHDSPAGVLTALAVSSQTVAVIGPTLGGLLIGLGGWRTTFAINVPLALACLLLGALWLPKYGASERKEAAEQQLGRFDYAGTFLFAAALVSLLLFLMSPKLDHSYLLAITVLAGGGFSVWERRVAAPFIDLRVLAGNLPLLATYGRTLLASLVSYAFIYGYAQWLEDGRGLSASESGLILLPMFATAILVSSTTGRRKEIRVKLLMGAATQILACAVLLLLHSASAIWLLLGLGLIMGIPQGLNSLANQNAVYYQSDPARMGASAGLLRTFTYLGAIIASAANGAFFPHTANTTGLHHLAVFMLIAGVIFLVMTALDRSLAGVGRSPDGVHEPERPGPTDRPASNPRPHPLATSVRTGVPRKEES